MFKAPIYRILISLLMVLTVGCQHGLRHDCSRIDTSIADNKAILDSPGPGHVHANFESVDDLTDVPPFPIEQYFCGDVIALELEQCCCAAAINSPLANIIDKQRQASCCSLGYNRCLDRFLAGQALQQRNKAAAIAGELFLRLVEVHLQRQLLEASFQRLQELRAASSYAADQGLATVDADNELDKQEISLNRKRLNIESSQLNIINKLNSVLRIDRCHSKTIEPVFELFPVFEDVDNQVQIELAINSRPDLIALNRGGNCIDPECYSILSQLDPTRSIGPGAAISAIRKCLLLQRLANRPDPAASIRNQQFMELKSIRQDLVRTEVSDAVLAIQTGYRKLILENQDLQRLETRLAAIEASAELDAQQAFLDSVENWIEQQSVRSNRISIAIDFEIAKVKSLAATGQWISICGLEPIESSAGCTCCIAE